MPNRLAKELSPYLRQHADNPVDWYPWGDEAIERARREDRPILLSIGYSACHWCHVMERESFEDETIARQMNELFVNVKVDREERPDLDQIYQLVVQLTGRSGGWPLTVFLTPALRPFFAGTYFPPADKHGMPGLPAVLTQVARAYRERRAEIDQHADEITQAIEKVTAMRGERADVPADFLRIAAARLGDRFDEEHGGFGGAPKFPNTMSLDVMLRSYRRHGDERSLGRVKKALDAMADGGIYDHLGGGFARYATDRRWRIPHFEKMLYDNALLARLYVDAWRATGDERYAQVARETLDYVLRQMTSPDGAFYSTEDADSEGEEGKFYVWTPEQLEALLGPDDARIAAFHFGVAPGGNFEEGTTVLHVSRPPEVVARQVNRSEAEVREALARARATLFEARERREHPFLDTKIIASWNGLMIGALAEAGGALGEQRYLDAARRALDFFRERMWQGQVLLRLAKDGETKGAGTLSDYADLAGAALDLYEATADGGALSFGQALVDAALQRFWDPEEGGFFLAPPEATDLIVRTKDHVDSAVPSGTSSMLHALLRLHALGSDSTLLERAEATIVPLAGHALDNPHGFGHLLGAMERLVHGSVDVVVVGRPDEGATGALLSVARRLYLPTRSLSVVPPDAVVEKLGGQKQIGSAPTAYVCRDRTCSAPVTDPGALRELLQA